MTKKEIFELESDNFDHIHLFLEGTFWIAYEKSAFRFVKFVRPYRIKKKFIKNVGSEMASLGFPTSALDGLSSSAPTLEIVSRSDKQATLKVHGTFTAEEFGQWKSEIPLLVPDTGNHVSDTSPEVIDISNPIPGLTEIICRIRNFDIGNKTPLECMFFISELKRIASANAI